MTIIQTVAKQNACGGGHQWPWKRLVRFLAADSCVYIGEPVEGQLDIGLAYAAGSPILVHVLNTLTPWDANARRTGEIKTVQKLLSPVSAAQCGAIRATGLSYTDHAHELGLEIPAVPTLFFKPATTLADPGEPVPVPRCAQAEELDYEVELAIVIGRDCRDVSPENALDYILGWTCANDLTARKQQNTSTQWGYSKGFDKFCPLGPCIVSTSLLADPRDVSLSTKLNGTLVQSGSAKKMIWPISEIISYLSQGTTLPAGTVVITGTPPGIGASHKPPIWLRDGDEVHCSISHGIGTLVNTIVYE